MATHPITGSTVVLTYIVVSHWTSTEAGSLLNLAAFCQRFTTAIDART